MAERDRLSDEDVHDRLQHASTALGDEPAATIRGSTAISAARRSLAILQFALLKAMEDGADQVPGVLLEPPSTRD